MCTVPPVLPDINMPQLDTKMAVFAARKAERGRWAESLAEDVKLVAARHQNAARRMEVGWRTAVVHFQWHEVQVVITFPSHSVF